MNNKGMTLLELLVYMALAALLLAPVIMLMNTSSKNMARDASNTDLRISGRDLLNIIYDDLKNTGFKLKSDFSYNDSATYLDTANSAAMINCDIHTENNPEYCGPDDYIRDSSSFIPEDGMPTVYYDRLKVKMGKLSKTGSWEGVDTIQYYVKPDSQLIRKKNNDPEQTLARNVAALQFQYSEDLIDWYDGDYYDATNPATAAADWYAKQWVRYIKVTIVLKDNKRLAAVNNQTIMVIDRPGSDPSDKLPLPADGQALYERHEIVVPIPNNGLYP
jgi:type II secretory pathway pseudopilin PulG